MQIVASANVQIKKPGFCDVHLGLTNRVNVVPVPAPYAVLAVAVLRLAILVERFVSLGTGVTFPSVLDSKRLVAICHGDLTTLLNSNAPAKSLNTIRNGPKWPYPILEAADQLVIVP